MAKETYYFSHDYNARNDEKSLELRACHGAEGYGVFWMLIETMAENENGGVKASLMGGLSLGFGVAKDKLKSIIDCCLSVGLLYEKDGYYFSNRLLEHKGLRKKLSEAGKIGAEKKWGGYGVAIGGGNGVVVQRKGKERKIMCGIGFSPDYKKVIFEDGSEQELGESQLMELERNNLSPKAVKKGHTY